MKTFDHKCSSLFQKDTEAAIFCECGWTFRARWVNSVIDTFARHVLTKVESFHAENLDPSEQAAKR